MENWQIRKQALNDASEPISRTQVTRWTASAVREAFAMSVVNPTTLWTVMNVINEVTQAMCATPDAITPDDVDGLNALVLIRNNLEVSLKYTTGAE